ncbi:DUF1642 domain-containing protein [Streptococcus gordonii]|uniref:DUF1642 domain-containing protein n=1 Tax=Streptococcus gordonii TaxID=1302 RepID=UPI000F690A13|nr:DUF1642 domain-containing protein [Streptococcus gordonii]RSK12861.1 hypothetical protein D8806_02390 [Streptococcus gordonii]
MNKQELIKKYEHMNHDSFRRVDVSQVLSDLIRLDGPQKVAIPQYVAEWIDYCKMRKISLAHALYRSDESVDKRVFCWVVDSLDNQETFAKAWIFGYEVEKEKRYLVKVKNVLTRQSALNRNKKSGRFIFSNPEENSLYDTKFTRKELEVAGFGEVFNSPLFEVEEVE